MATYYVDINAATDTGAGTIGDPWRYVNTHTPGDTANGDTILIRGSAVPGAPRVHTETGAIVIEDDNLTISPYTGEYVELRGQASANIITVRNDGFTLDGQDRLEINRQSNHSRAIYIFASSRTPTNTTIRNVEIYNTEEYAIYFEDADTATVQYCTIYDGFAGNSTDAYGVYVQATPDVLIEYCTIYDIAGDCIQIGIQSGSYFTIRYNTLYTTLANCSENAIDIKRGDASYQSEIHNNTIYGFRYCDATCGGSGAQGEGIVIQQSAQNTIVYENTIYNCENGISFAAGASGIDVYKNTIRDLVTGSAIFHGAFSITNSSNIDIYNNTIHNCNADDFIRFTVTATNITLTNNIFRTCDTITNASPSLTASYNCWSACTDTISGTGDVTADPLFTDEAGDDFTLTSTSPCRNAGINVGLPFNGSAPDMGRYESEEAIDPDPPIIGAEGVGAAFFVIGSPRFQARVLPIVVREPIWIGSNLIDDTVGFYAEGLSITWAAFGGFWSAQFGITGRQSQIEDWLENGLGRDITIYNPSLVVIFEGFVNNVNANIGGLTLSRGPFLDIGNDVQLAYSTVDTSVTPPAVGVRASTDVATDADSQTLYGERDKIISVGGISVANAELVRDTALDEIKDPETDSQFNLGSSAIPSVTLEILGYVRMLETYVYNSTTTGTGNLSTKIQSVLTADPNSTFSADYTEIETNATPVGQYEQDDRVAMSIIKGLTAMGNATNDRTLFGIYEGRKARYETIPSDVSYQRSVLRAEQALETYGAGQRVLPWNIEPGKWIFYTDLLAAKPIDLDNKRGDLRFSLIEEATYTAPWGLSLKGGKANRLDQLMARLGLGGTAA